jgi:CheY-like chemotaxis protein
MLKFRIMVVDDDPDIRFVVSSLLSLDFESVQASNGLDALEKIERTEPDLLLMDINMPIMNGLSCCSAIKRDPNFEHLPVIFVSASSDPEVRASAMAAGGVAFFEKPFDTRQLTEAIHAHFAALGVTATEKMFSVAEVESIDSAPLAAAEGWAAVSAAEPSTDEDHSFANEPTVAIEPPVDARKRRVFGKQRPATEPQAEPTVEPVTDPVAPPKKVPEPIVPAPEVELPPPPTPDYGRISKEFQRKLDVPAPPPPPVAKPAAPVQPPPPARPTAAPAPIALPPAGRPAPMQPAAPPAPVEAPRVVPIVPPAASAPPPMEPIAPAAAPSPAIPSVPAALPARRPAAPAAAAGPSPADLLAARRKAALAKVGAAPQQSAGAALKLRVLVMIDFPDQLTLCHEACRGFAEFLPLEDPVEALVLIARFQPDIVMCGIREKRYSGLEIGQMIRSNARLSHIELAYLQGAWAEPAHVQAATALSRNSIIRPPLTAQRIKNVLQEVARKPGFQVRSKALSYGVYVKEVIKSAEAERLKQNKVKEKESYEDQYQSLVGFMARELKDYREPQGMDELKGVGAKVHRVDAE